MKVAIIGCGSWGLGIGFVLHSNGHQLHYYTPFKEQAQSLRETRTDDRTLSRTASSPPMRVKLTTCARTVVSLKFSSFSSYSAPSTGFQLLSLISISTTQCPFRTRR